MITIQEEKCIGCGLCVSDCVAGFLYLDGGKAKVRAAGCISCGHCYAICPRDAVSIPEFTENNGDFASMADMDSTHLLQAMKSRRTMRQFTSAPVETEKLQMILEAGRYCPTGSNAQDVAYTVLGSRQDEIEAICVNLFRKGIGAAGKFSAMARNINVDDHYFFKGASLVIVVSGKGSVNASLASSYMELMAESLGLGVLYSGFFIACTRLSGKIRKILDLPKGHKAVTCMVIGYPKVHYRRIPGRKKINVRTL